MAGALPCCSPPFDGVSFRQHSDRKTLLRSNRLQPRRFESRKLNSVSNVNIQSFRREEEHSKGSRRLRRNSGVRGTASDAEARTDFVLDGEDESEIPPPPPPTQGRFEIVVDNDMIARLDLSSAHEVLQKYAGMNLTADPGAQDPSAPSLNALFHRTIGFTLNYERADPVDPRELSELSDVRLWFVRLDSAYPWLPAVLDWRGGELARYSAMLIPHQMSKRLGVVFNPEALELWSMTKFFTVYEWLRAKEVARPDVKVKEMMTLLGFRISDVAYQIVESDPLP